VPRKKANGVPQNFSATSSLADRQRNSLKINALMRAYLPVS
jgi:hypothetical protein